MKATVWYGKHDVRLEQVPDPKILNPRDAILRITSTAICGSDLHLYNGFVPGMMAGDILGHEFMGEVVEVGSEIKNLKVGDRVVNPFPISCGQCFFCQETLFSLCENSNPNSALAEKMWGHSPAGLFGYTHLLGGYAGGQSEYARVPYADVGPIKIPDGIPDEQVSVPGVYGGFLDKLPFGAVVNRALTIKSGQTHVQRYLAPLLKRIQEGEVDPSFIITHQLPLDEAAAGYDMFLKKQDDCVKVVLKPGQQRKSSGQEAMDRLH